MDLIDRKILCELDIDCRQPVSVLARKLRTSRRIVAYRIANLEHQGIIHRYICTIDLGKLGYRTYKIYLRLHRTGGASERKFVALMLSDHRVIHFLKTEGTYDYSITVAVRTIGELDDLLMGLKRDVPGLLIGYEVTIVVRSKIFKLDKLLIGKKALAPKIERYSGEEQLVSIDAKDEAILRELAEAANLPIVDLAQRTGLSVDAARYRLRALRKSVILSFRVMFDHTKIGFHRYIILATMRRAGAADESHLVEWCAARPEVLFLSKKIGPADYEINIAARDTVELTGFLSAFKREFGQIVDSSEVLINTALLKLNYVPF